MPDPSEFMHEALRLAAESVREGGGPFGAVIVKDGEIIARGRNRVASTNDPTAHAEIMAVRKACERLGSFQLEGCDVYTSTEPCPMCMGALYWARPARVYFASEREDAAAAGFDDGFIYDELARAVEARDMEMHHLELAAAGEEFDLWRAKSDRVQY